MSADTAREALCLAVADSRGPETGHQVTSASGGGRTVQSPQLAAAYVMAMPEMKAIKAALLSLAQVVAEYASVKYATSITAEHALIGHFGLDDDPAMQHVVDWVQAQ